jgi:hypothetical protein
MGQWLCSTTIGQPRLSSEGLPIQEKHVSRYVFLDIVEVAKSHTGVNLATAFARILEDYGISEKLMIINIMLK